MLSSEGRGTVLVVDWTREGAHRRQATVSFHLTRATGRASVTRAIARAANFGPGTFRRIIPFHTLLDEMDEPFQPEFSLHRTHG